MASTSTSERSSYVRRGRPGRGWEFHVPRGNSTGFHPATRRTGETGAGRSARAGVGAGTGHDAALGRVPRTGPVRRAGRSSPPAPGGGRATDTLVYRAAGGVVIPCLTAWGTASGAERIPRDFHRDPRQEAGRPGRGAVVWR
ncbi:hypothetical protein QJS66_15970 [Kocuria rhizophila]|nr:hypothetical protein QJS66_15970 [Kocuria rhizophila]